MKIAVFVLGDVGRSPRTMYHAVSMLEHGHDVRLIGYAGSKVSLVDDARLRLITPLSFSNVPWAVSVPFKLVYYSLAFSARVLEHDPDVVWCQSPPAIPTVFVCMLVKVFSPNAHVVVDVHNLAHTLLELRLDGFPLVVRKSTMFVATTLEYLLYYVVATSLLTVSDALKSHLSLKDALVFHDAPFGSMACAYKNAAECSRIRNEILGVEEDAFLVVSATSWSLDEDFSLFIKGLRLYDAKATKRTAFVFSGRGPQKEEFEGAISRLVLKNSTVSTIWLEFKDYPFFLGCADLGLSLHGSSSSLDLPMKVVDMLGCGLPVLSLNFSCLSELLTNDLGFVFDDDPKAFANELLRIVQSPELLNEKRRNVRLRSVSWRASWNCVVAPFLTSAGARKSPTLCVAFVLVLVTCLACASARFEWPWT